MRNLVFNNRLLAFGAAAVMACSPSDSQVFALGEKPDSLNVRAEMDSVVLTNPDTTFGPVDTVIVVRTDTVVAVPDSVLVVDTIIEGFDTTFVVDTVVTLDTIVATSVDTTVTVDTVVVADTIRVQTRLVAASNSQSLKDGLTIDSGRTARLTVSAINRLDQPTVPSTVTWLSDAPGTASVNEGLVTGKRPGNANIFAIAQGLSATIPTTIQRADALPGPPPPLPEGSQSRFFRAHEPSGMTRVTERSFTSLTEGWTYDFDRDPGGKATIVSDSDSPHSPSGVVQFNYREGLPGGRGSVNRGIEVFNASYRRIYLYHTFKMDPNWQGHQSRTNKVWYIHHEDPPIRAGWSTFFSAGTIDDRPVDVVVEGQEHAEPTPFLRFRPNVEGERLVRGRWHELEFLLTGSTPGQQNGSLKVWVDGVLTHEYSDVGYFREGGGDGFDAFQFDAIWGGIGDEKVSDQWLRVGHVYISGSN
ncbi:MAG: hypothetical protein HKN72_11795 [Gemmatimonadetes bacterium]|nr:hypothetical protein [Gemmatimonadota bacterium]